MKTAAQVLETFDNIRRAQRAGVYAPHKPLLILLATQKLTPEMGAAKAASFAVGFYVLHNVFYAGFDNGGVWRTTDFGSTWKPLFDKESTGSIGAIAVAPSNPSILYVGTGAGIIRPDLAVGDGMYRSNDAGKSWTHLGLRESQMIAWVEVDPKNPERLFVAALGHPYGPNAERGIFRSTNGGQSFERGAFGAVADDLQGRNRVAVVEFDGVLLAVAPNAALEPARERVDDGHADAVQAAGDLVGVLVELAAGVQLREHDFGG